MNSADDRLGGWATGWRRIAAAPHAPVVAGVLPALLALAESIAHARGTPAAHPFGHTVSRPVSETIVHLGSTPPAGNTGTALYLVVFGLLGLATTLPIALLWGQPAAAAVAVSASVVLSLTAFQTLTVAGLGAQLIAGYRIGRGGPWLPAVLLAAPFPLLALAGPAGGEVGVLTLLLASLAPAAALAGIARRAHGEALENTAARQVIADTLLEHTARGERARIARELHDVVAHHISMVAVQAETARLAVPGMPAAGADRLSAIGDTARAALTEMRRLLGVLREDAAADAADRQPQPGLRLGELNELLDESRDASGTGVRLILHGAPVVLDPGVELAAYRIVQEALTNARRHAPGAAVDVELHYTDDALRLSVRDNGPGPSTPAPAGGHGLSGMRERAVAVGGELRTGPAAGGGFLVEARLRGRAEAAG
ncbi:MULTISPECIES: sensor histidine kinase [Streptosporangium]|uniref:histidine kinase n=1 Tax=Streptosporangium brasiliense TaxID=47480 RepID=A0ABT9RMR7_9ACTN|nr:sensor histidine kinase [Streptosporangium brasiliense]MDP9869615.1 signal transduction histidine kinase [Streptosporangium brasiliense]